METVKKLLEYCEAGVRVEKREKNVAGSWTLSWHKWPREFFGIGTYISLKLSNQPSFKVIWFIIILLPKLQLLICMSGRGLKVPELL